MPGVAQEIDFEGQKVAATSAPRDAMGQSRADALSDAGLQAQIIYLQKFDGGIEQKDPPKATAEKPTAPLISGPMAMVLVFGVLIAALGLWVYVSGGALWAPDTAGDTSKAVQAPKGWGESEADLLENRSLAQIAQMADRRAAVVRLLRLCLLHAAEATKTGFKRSDTERDAFGRVPLNWSGSGYLKRLLITAELAHYGGRSVDEATFQALIEGARGILPRQRGGNV
ncbi:MAG: hypothetical protein V4586_19475 [Pseudomonadota bacterium]